MPIAEGTAEEAALRGVERLMRFPGPNGVAQEIFVRARRSDYWPPDMAVRGGFVTGEGGMGHITLASKKPHQVRGYYNTVFDARLTDYIDETISGLKFKIRFLPVNQRHHSIAIAAVNRLPINPIRTRVQHVNIQVADLDDMTASYQRGERPRLPAGTGGRAAHQRPRTVLLRRRHRRASNGKSAGIRSSSTRRPGSQRHIRASASGATPGRDRPSSRNWRSSRPRLSRCCAAKTPSPRWLIAGDPGRLDRRRPCYESTPITT